MVDPAVQNTEEFKPNLEKLKRLQQQASSVVIGGKGVPRRKKKIIHKTASTDDKKLQSSLKKLTVNHIPGIDEVNMFKDNGEVINFVNPKVQASLTSNIFAISGHSETKPLTEMLPTIMQQLGGDNMFNLKNLAKELEKTAQELKVNQGTEAAQDEEIPELVENFDEASKNEKI
ncbi:Transcription factor BTF3 -like protein [Brachionus plicatilis]|uniref:Transcription factor BTF3 n=1 Tax=Brachionus plicatilis TaxID=10195 RepID=A0A3M7QTR7_BRAPC|nr:Transcription factor BTF3 -like protein [Brachionus plicatilis]